MVVQNRHLAALCALLPVILLCIALASPWWITEDGSRGTGETFGLWKHERAVSWPWGSDKATDVDDECDFSDGYRDVCARVKALRAFCILTLISLVLTGFGNAVLILLVQARANKISAYFLMSAILCMGYFFSALGILIAVLVDLPGEGWSLSGSGFYCYVFSFVLSLPCALFDIAAARRTSVCGLLTAEPPENAPSDALDFEAVCDDHRVLGVCVVGDLAMISRAEEEDTGGLTPDKQPRSLMGSPRRGGEDVVIQSL